MFNINQGFDLNSPQFNFKRDYFESVAALKAADLNGFPDHFITNVAGVLYQLTKSNSNDTTTGKWRKVELGSDVDLSGYAKKSEAIKSISFSSTPLLNGTTSNTLNWVRVDNTTGSAVFPLAIASNSDGLMSAADKAKLDAIAEGANKFTLEKATDKLLGGILTGYTNNGKNYKVELDTNGRAFVNVPWTDTKTDLSNCVKNNEDGTINGNLTVKQINATTASVSKVSFTTDSGGITFGDNDDTTYIVASTKQSANSYFATDGTIRDIPKVEAISDDFINALS